MIDYPKLYDRWTKWFREEPRRIKVLEILNLICTWGVAGMYAGMIIYMLINHHPKTLRCILIPLISLILITIVRKLLNRPRPYTKYDINPLIEKDKVGYSMPSRHIFSSAIIMMVGFELNPILGIILLLLTIVAMLLRVILGLHYPQDVLAGLFLGIFLGLFI